jgi:predicted negative regulator of RcsB-dependent stress response
MSKKHPGARRTAKKEEHDDDVFVAKVLEIGTWAKANQQLLTVAGVVLAIVFAGVMYYGNYREALTQQAAQQLEGIHQSISLQDREGAKTQLATFLQRFEGTAYAGEARLLLGDLYLQTDDPQQALAVLEPMAASPREPIEFQAAALLAVAYEQEERWSDAEGIYLRIADRSELDFQVRDALTSAARIRAEQGNAAGAVELYRRILDETDENAPERGIYEMRITELQSAANI